MKKRTKNQNKSKTGKIDERYFGVMLENLDSKFDLIFEGHGGLDKEIKATRKAMDERFNQVDNKLDHIADELYLIRNEL